MKFLIEKLLNKNPIIINPRHNPPLATKIQTLLINYSRTIPMKRDNCGPSIENFMIILFHVD